MTWQESEGEEWKGEQPDLNGWDFFQSDLAPKSLGMFILDENNSPVLADSTLAWGEWYETNTERRRVGLDVVGHYEVSTVFLGLDQSFTRRGWPILFETMIFRLGKDGDRDPNAREGDDIDMMMERYQTWQQAEAGHARFIEYVKQALSAHQK